MENEINEIEKCEDDMPKAVAFPDHPVPIEALGLSCRAYNCLMRTKIDTVQKLFEFGTERLLGIRNLGRKSADEIIAAMQKYLSKAQAKAQGTQGELTDEQSMSQAEPMDIENDYSYLKTMPIKALHLSYRSQNALKRNNIFTVAELISFQESDLMKIKNLGKTSVDEIIKKRELYIREINYKSSDESSEQAQAINEIQSGAPIIGSLDLSVRASNALKRAGINTVGELMALTANDIRLIKNIGETTLHEMLNCKVKFQPSPLPGGN